MYEPLAIVGTACRFPGAAKSPSRLWDLLKAPRDVLKEFPPERLNTANFYHNNGDMHGRTNVEHKSYLLDEDVRHFDAAFFHLNPKEAADMDPQQRILLETVYEAFEAAGWSLSDVDGSQTSVHVGSMTEDYTSIQSRDPDMSGSHVATGVSRAILSNRISYAFNLQGASLSLDTACSSSLVALHLAAQGLHRGEATQAVVAGTNLLMDPFWYIAESSMHLLSTDSRCRMWDKDASGYARGEGCAAVVLKTLAQAVRDGDHIECVIRGSLVNSDGATNGITMPSPAAQSALIQQTYRNAGLDPITDRCQYFECHGTGTQAGDPVESQAIRDTFFPDNKHEDDSILYCGSIKTIIGHLEGCAGLAGVIKASLAIQNKAIPPNMHFNQLNPKVEPFYKNLEVPTSLMPWPEIHDAPRRASVNSFGFGGTNAHAILESYEPSETIVSSLNSSTSEIMDDSVYQSMVGGRIGGPFVFSARSRTSLVNWLKQLLTYLRENQSLDLDSLSSSLYSKRTAFPYRVAIPAASDLDDLVQKLEDQINTISTSMDGSGAGAGFAAPKSLRILGIFTGQGAQAARMGCALLEHCKLFKESIIACEEALKCIPEPPPWSLSEELAADATKSRVSEAKFSQPLCTAIQIGLVDLLRACGIKFSAVVGHSSGDIGAAYAAGLLTRKDAMGISYYRGHVAHLARGDAGESGGMMAAAMPFDAASALCSEPRFKNRINVAASNSPSSVTLSGAKDAIVEMKEHLDRINIQARALQVDVAYHSHHMLACADAYLGHLKQLDIRIQTPPTDQECHWYSSVRANTNILERPFESGLEAQYWVDNMVQPVLFSEAVKLAVQVVSARFSAAMEIGPHPALKGPVNQTFKQSIDYTPQYTSCLSRGNDDIETFSEMLAMIWTIDPSSIDFASWRKAFGLAAQPQVLKNLPPYAWDHTQIHWRESRVVRNYRLGKQPPHDLLGRLWNDAQYEHTWRNIFQLKEMPWVKGHVFQGQVLFPATGYISLAVDAAKAFITGRPIKLVEVLDMAIPTALVIGEGDEVEVLFTIRSRVSPEKVEDGSILEAEFACYSYPDGREADKTCDGRLLVHLGEPEPEDLAPTNISNVELTPFNVDRFYRAASDIGFGYDGTFRALTSLNRCWGHAKAVASWPKDDLDVCCTLHPAILDVALQAGLATFVSTAERSMPSSYLPVGIKRALVHPNVDFLSLDGSTNIEIEAYMTSPELGKLMEADINVRAKKGTRDDLGGIQLEGVRFKAISEPQPSEDRNIFAKTVWGLDAAYGLVQPRTAEISARSSMYTPEEYERVALFYLQSLARSVNARELNVVKHHHQDLMRFIDATVAQLRKADHPVLMREWLNDSSDTIKHLLSRDPSDVDMAMLASSAEWTLTLLEGTSEYTHESLPSSFYHNRSSATTCNEYIAQLVLQISHQFPRTNILEISAGVRNTTSTILGTVGDAYAHYTCAGASETVIKSLKEKLVPAETENVSFKVFEVEADLASQGFEAGSYDIVIATDVLRASRYLSRTVQNMRRLIRPGGFLIAMEFTGTSLRPTAIMGGLETWWAGVSDRGTASPVITTGEWDKLLERHGFSGIDCTLHDQANVGMHGFSVFSSQATDDRLDILRDPLISMDMITPPPVILIGGETSKVSRLVRQAEKMVRGWATEIQAYSRFDQIDCSRIPPGASVISFQDLDKPLFSSPPSPSELRNLKQVLDISRNILWVTSRRMADDPYANIMIGIGRSLRLESPDTTIHYLDFDEDEPWDIQVLMAQFLRLIFSSSLGVAEGMLWVEEPEIVIKDSQILVPRILPDQISNEVYNAKRRQITKLVEPAEPIEIAKDVDSADSVLICSRSLDLPENHVPIQVKLSVALHDGNESPCFLCYGNVKDQGDRVVLTLSETDSSVAHVREDSDFSSLGLQECDAEDLANLASFLIASHVVSNIPGHGTTLVCGASDRLADAIRLVVAGAGCKALFVAISKERQSEHDGWLYVHPQSTARSFQQMIPRGPINLYGLSKKNTDTISRWLPAGCTSVEDAVRVYSTHQESLASASKPAIVNIHELPQPRDSSPVRLSVVTNWKRESSVGAILRGLEPSALLSPDKTYFLVGMASELGQSLTYFMIRAGARHIVLSSRNPKGGQNWIHDLQAIGIEIRVVKMDVTSRSQVRETVAMLRRTMPEIGGVTNAALVLEPAIFANLSAESIAKQMKPKIYGTANLDDEFKTSKLDFFLTFGSLSTVCGNAGHAIYHAGNAFMMSLVQNRRRRGLAASILNFGMLVDVGYVARSDRSAGPSVEEWLRTDLPTALSEADFHHVILQGIAAGHPNSPSGEVIMGLEMFHDQGQSSKPRWANAPLFSHMVRVSKASKDGQADDAPSSIQRWQQNLEDAISFDEAIPPITELLSRKIESMIHVSLHSIHPDEPMSHLGIDSINAIEIRKWLREKLEADISMLKILGRDSISSIIRTVAEQYIAKRPATKSMSKGEISTAEVPQPNKTLAPKADPNAQKESTGPTLSNHGHDARDSEASLTSSQCLTGISNQIPGPQLPFIRSERLSYAQAGFFYLSAFSDSRTSFNLTGRFRIKGRLDTERFCRAFDQVMHHHEALRTCFLATSGSSEVMQHVTKNATPQISRLQSTKETAKVDVEKAFDEIAKHEYSLATGDTLRATLISHGAQWHTLVIGFHNIALDAVSMRLLFADIDRAYRFQTLSQDSASYLDFTRQEIDDVQAGRLDESIDYWKRLLDPIPEPIPLLPTAKVKTRQNRRSYGYHLVKRELSSELVQRVTQISQAHGVTPMQFYLAVMRVFLCRLLDIDDICIGVMSHGRDPTSRFGDTVGHMANILPIRFKGSWGECFPEVLENTFKTLLDSFDNRNVPFAVVLEKIQALRSEGGMPLVQVAYDYRVGENVANSVGGCTMELEETIYTTLYDLTIDVLQSTSHGHLLNIRCSDDFYSLSTTEFIAETFVNVIESLAPDPSVAVKDIGLFSDTQLQQATTVAHGADVEHSWPQSLSERFEQVVANFPGSVAVKDGNEAITYNQLKQLVEIYANILLEAKTTAGSLIAVLCEPSIDLYATMLAVFHIGAVFIPLDVSVPAARRNDMMKACQPDLLVFHAATAASATEDHGEYRSLNIAEKARAHPRHARSPERTVSDPGSDSYILFTSGSTGVPKGIKLHQRGMMNYAAYTSKAYGFKQVRVLQQTSIGFDLSFAQIYNAFTNGGTLVVASVEARGDPDMLSRFIIDEMIEYTIGTPSEYNLLLSYASDVLQQCRSWRFCHTAGEALPERLIEGVRELKLPNLTLTDAYGPAEAFIVTNRNIQVHAGAIQDECNNRAGSVGYVLPNTSVYITSESDGSLLPLGVPGEICIAGSGLFNGYLDTELGDEKFVENPFASAEYLEQGFHTMYKSGDRGILHADGSIVFLGRCFGYNAMIKLRGLRIDLNEVTGAILGAAPNDLADAAVTVRGDPQFLIINITGASTIEPARGSILINFGGPGGDGQQNLAATAEFLQNMTGGFHDIISFDPRLFAQIPNTATANSSDTALGHIWAEAMLSSDACLNGMNESGTLVGTAFVARDMMKIVDALGEDGMLRYYVLGATVASMFPDRMDRVLLDGVVNPDDYYHGPDTVTFTDTDKTFRSFLSGCVTAGDACALAHRNQTPAELESSIHDFLQILKYEPIPVAGLVLDYSIFKATLLGSLYWPSGWPQLAAALDSMLSNDIDTLAQHLDYLVTPAASIQYEALPGIKCSDKFPRLSSSKALVPIMEEFYEISEWCGETVANLVSQCAQWQFDAKERYDGDFQVQTRNPVLLVGNTFDPVTPLAAAQNVSAGFDGSVVLQHNGNGHSSWAQRSACTMKAIADYFVNGTLPEPGTVCEVDAPLFSETE
ncbi:polyketide synthase 3 [Pseudomassariella vexata]|uniref:Polyketide synthase 3 n=1 Tax=Pseudomassariella vexata TaxID=1141098 RepID=A0A1Y2EIB5_9PEZI|nr:polyketide synthase 3 [Pseudomassariella vexata]ORY71044.1 polyketide synthase 3 [Pseudomassariella vexata]